MKKKIHAHNLCRYVYKEKCKHFLLHWINLFEHNSSQWKTYGHIKTNTISQKVCCWPTWFLVYRFYQIPKFPVISANRTYWLSEMEVSKINFDQFWSDYKPWNFLLWRHDCVRSCILSLCRHNFKSHFRFLSSSLIAPPTQTTLRSEWTMFTATRLCSHTVHSP